ncbi:LuxR C-terminal-related transcriptional regulator [Streptosporangium sp. NPDC051023]|uniref:response regulator transcription factor n=1 Tax=Streptosporangium sp. NPDC051023 TaxID=3155410 RepID=UPI00344C0168
MATTVVTTPSRGGRSTEPAGTDHGNATELHMSLSTVKTHLESVHIKLGVRNRVEAAGFAFRSGRMDGR